METISRDEVADIAWLSGIIDGEGMMMFKACASRGFPQVYLAVKNTSPHMIQRISEIYVRLSVNFHFLYEKSAKNGKHDVPWKERLTIAVGGSRGVRKILEAIFPYLTAKRDEAQCLLEYLRWRIDEVPVHFPRNTKSKDGLISDLCEEVRKRQLHTKFELQKLKRRAFSFQRLPRRSSTVLELSHLELMV